MCTGLTPVTEFGLFFLGLLVQADGRCLLPSVHILHRREAYRYALHLLPFDLLPRLLYIPLYIPLSFHSLSLPASLPEGASRCSATGLTGDNKPVSCSRRPPCDKSNNRLLLSVSASVHHRGAALLYLITGKRHRAFQKRSASLLLAERAQSLRDLC